MNETLVRLASGIVYVVLLLFCVTFSKESFFALFGTFLLIASFEFSKLVNLNKWLLISIAALSLVFIYPHFNNKLENLDYIITLFSVTTLFYLIYNLFLQKENPKKLDFMYFIGYIILPFIIALKIPFDGINYRPKIFISIIILIWTNDTFAYLVGKNFGKNKLFPSISPKKTIEGFVGGMIFTVICGLLLANYYINANSPYIWIIIALIVSVFSTIGDLIESKFKRSAGVKDSGKIMPGHGGILDRLDSIIFVVPFIYLFYLIKNYVS